MWEVVLPSGTGVSADVGADSVPQNGPDARRALGRLASVIAAPAIAGAAATAAHAQANIRDGKTAEDSASALNAKVSASSLAGAEMGQGAATVGFKSTMTSAAEYRRLQDKVEDIVSLLDVIPYGERAGINERTSNYDCTSKINDILKEMSGTGGRIIVPRGLYQHEGTVSLQPGVALIGEGKVATTIRRIGDIVGLQYVGPRSLVGDGAPGRDVTLSNLEVRSAGVSKKPLVDLRGVAYLYVDRCRFLASRCCVFDMTGVWDFYLMNSLFANGGDGGDGTPMVRLAGGSGYGVGTKDGLIHGCTFEHYSGIALQTDARPMRGFDTRPHLIRMSDCKFDTIIPSALHLDLLSSYLWTFSNVLLSSACTSGGDVIRLGNGDYWRGGITVHRAAVSTGTPRSAVRLENASHISLDLQVSNQPSGMDALSWDGKNAETIDVSITGRHPTVNGGYANPRTLRNAVVRQVGTEGDQVSYSWEKHGCLTWSIGYPATLNGSINEFEFRAGTTNMLRLRVACDGNARMKRELIPNCQIVTGKRHTDTNLLRLQDQVFWQPAIVGRLRMATAQNDGTPSADAAGLPFSFKVDAPLTAASVGKPGDWAADRDYIYAYTGDGTAHSWVRSAAAAW